MQVGQIKPLAHIFGHVHDAAGFVPIEDTLFVNAAQDLTRRPMYFDIIPKLAESNPSTKSEPKESKGFSFFKMFS
jgi:hypothetical protein